MPRLPRRAAKPALAMTMALGLGAALVACGNGEVADDHSHAGYAQTNLVANWDGYKPQIVEKGLKNAWGISMRPAGAGGHFWITANGTGTSYEYVGDVHGEKLHTDGLKEVTLPRLGDNDATPTGTVFNAGGKGFVITQKMPDGISYTGPATFLFATDDGRLVAWTERKNPDGSKSQPTDSLVVLDHSAAKAAYFGLAISPTHDRLYLANFGDNPGIQVLDEKFAPVADAGFTSPFIAAYKPWNVQTIGDSVFVLYAESDEFAEEEPGPGEGKIAEFTPDGKLVATWNGGNYVNAPWGIAKAPDTGFGPYSGKLLVGNFGDGTIAVLDPVTHKAIDFLRRPDGNRVEIDGLWGLTFGNGESLGEKDALYFAAGPGPEADGLFGRLTYVEGAL